MDESTVNVPARSPTPAAAHTGAGWAAPAHSPTHPRPSARPSDCPPSASVPQAEQESVPGSNTEAGAEGISNCQGKSRQQPERAAAAQNLAERGAGISEVPLQSSAVLDAPRQRIEREAGGLSAELDEIGSLVMAQSAHSSKSPSELIYVLRILWVYN